MSLILDALRRKSAGREGARRRVPANRACRCRARDARLSASSNRRPSAAQDEADLRRRGGRHRLRRPVAGDFSADAAGDPGASGGRADRDIGCGAARKSGRVDDRKSSERIDATDRGAAATERAGSGSRESHRRSAPTERHSGGRSGLETAGRGSGRVTGRGTGRRGAGRVAVEHDSRDVNAGAKA